MEFDPYLEWLAIPTKHRPPTHYQLLGLKRFEDDTDKIHRRTLKRVAHLRQFQAGEHGDLTQSLMNEISQARLVLLDPVQKEAYDQSLRAKLGLDDDDEYEDEGPGLFSRLAGVLGGMFSRRPKPEADDSEDSARGVESEEFPIPAGAMGTMDAAGEAVLLPLGNAKSDVKSDEDRAADLAALTTPVASDEDDEFGDIDWEVDTETDPELQRRVTGRLRNIAIACLALALMAGIGVILMVRDTTPDNPTPNSELPKDQLAELVPDQDMNEPEKDSRPREKWVPTRSRALPRTPNLEDLMVTNFSEGAIPTGMLLAGFGSAPLPMPADPGLRFTPKPGTAQDIFLPLPPDEFRLGAEFSELPKLSPGQRIEMGIVAGQKDFLIAEVAPRESEMAIALVASTKGRVSRKGVVLSGDSLWIDFRREGKKVILQAATDGVHYQTIGEAKWEGAAGILALRVMNYPPEEAVAAAKPVSVELRSLRLDSPYVDINEDNPLAQVIRFWPLHVPMPDPATISSYFAGRLRLEADGAHVEYPFEGENSALPWKGKWNPERESVVVDERTQLDHGPVLPHAIRFRFLFPSYPSVWQLRFQGGGSITFNASRRQVTISGRSPITFPFELGEEYEGDLHLGADDRLELSLNDRPVIEPSPAPGAPGTNTPAGEGGAAVPLASLLSKQASSDKTSQESGAFTGTVSTAVLEGKVEFARMELSGPLDIVPLWIAAVNKKADLDQLAAQTKSLPRRPIPVPGWFRKLLAGELPKNPMSMARGVPINLGFVNTPSDEDHPILDADQTVLFFTRQVGDTAELLAANRISPAYPFHQVGRLEGLPKSKTHSLTPGAASDQFVFANNQLGDFNLFLAPLQANGELLSSGLPIAAARSGADEINPTLSPDGLELYFVRRTPEGTQLMRARRESLASEFEMAEPALAAKNVESASVTADGRVLYVGERDPSGRSRIVRYVRASRDGVWRHPQPVAETESVSGTQGSQAPCITPDGQYLYFASDRDGGKGGLDLWMVPLDRFDADKVLAELNPNKDGGNEMMLDEPPERAFEPIVPLAGPLRDWLVIGPIARDDVPLRGNFTGLQRLVVPVLKLEPKVGQEFETMKWVRQRGIPGEVGAYLISVPFDLDRTTTLQVKARGLPGGAIFWLDKRACWKLPARNDPWEVPPRDVTAQTSVVRLSKGRHYLTGIICRVTDERQPRVELIDVKTQNTPEGIEANYSE